MSNPLEQKRSELQATDEQLMELFKQRMAIVEEIKQLKVEWGLAAHQEIERLKKLDKFRAFGEAQGIDTDQMEAFYNLLHQLAVEHQNR